MTTAKVLVVGAAGQTGKHILKALIEDKEAKWTPLAGIFAQDKEEQERSLSKFENVTRVVMDWHNEEQMVQNLRDVDEVVLVLPPTADKKAVMQACIRAIHAARVKFTVMISMYGVDERDFVFGQMYHEVEASLKSEAEFRAHCIVRPQYYVQNVLLLRDMIKKGQLPFPIGGGRFAPIDADDVGQAVCTILKNPIQHSGKVYNLTGPAALTSEEMAKTFSELTGQEVKVNDSTSIAKAHLKQAIPSAELLGVLELYQVIADGKLGETSPDLEHLLGRRGCSLEQWAKVHVEFFK